MPPKRKKIVNKPPTLRKKRAKKDVSKIMQPIKKEGVSNLQSPENSNVCNVCNQTFDKDKWKQHTKVCTEDSLQISFADSHKAAFNCKECPKKFKFKKSFTAHLRNEHSTLPDSVRCEHCHVRCPNENVLKEHVLKVHERDIYVCSDCNKEFVRHSHVIRHMAQSGCNGRGVASYPCEICDSTFTRKDNLIVHLRTKHIHKKLFYCKYCEFAVKSFSKLVAHWHKSHSGSPNMYECHHCGKATSSRAAMAKHLEIHGEKKYSCDVCGYSTFTVEVMRRHILTHVEDKPYKCTLCHRSYIQRVQLHRHLEKHTGYMCFKCGSTFISKAKLLVHQREHMGLEKLSCTFKSCPLSNKEFSSEASLELHLKTHLVGKSYECEVCNKKFHLEVNMRRHLATHTLDRPRRCMYCVVARAYVRGEQLVRHVRRHHAAVFRQHLQHVRRVLGVNVDVERVKKSEMDSILNVLDAESERIMRISGSGVLYGGMQEADEPAKELHTSDSGPLMTEEELAENLNKLLVKLIDKDTLECFGWPNETVDVVLEKVIEHCGAKPANRDMWTRVQRLRENTKHLFLYVIEDKAIARMLDTHTIDQIIKHILAQVTEEDSKS